MVKLTEAQITKLYEFAGKTPPGNVTERDISQILVEIERKFIPYYSVEVENTGISHEKNILVVDDLEVTLFQLTKLLAKSGYHSFIARTAEEAIDIYKKQDFDYIFLDLFLPEALDGINLLETFKKFEKTGANNTKIIIISGSEDKQLIGECFEKGAFDFICKTRDWHVRILDLLRHLDEVSRGPDAAIISKIEDEENKIVSLKIKNIFKEGVIDDLKRETLNLVNLGYKNLILDLCSVNSANLDVLNLIVHIFRTSSQDKGTLKLCNVNRELADSLSFVFLDGVIPLFRDKESALQDFYRVL